MRTDYKRAAWDLVRFSSVALDWAIPEMEDLPKSGEIARTAPPDAHDAQLSNGPIGTSIRVREVPIQQCQLLTSHSTQLWS